MSLSSFPTSLWFTLIDRSSPPRAIMTLMGGSVLLDSWVSMVALMAFYREKTGLLWGNTRICGQLWQIGNNILPWRVQRACDTGERGRRRSGWALWPCWLQGGNKSQRFMHTHAHTHTRSWTVVIVYVRLTIHLPQLQLRCPQVILLAQQLGALVGIWTQAEQKQLYSLPCGITSQTVIKINRPINTRSSSPYDNSVQYVTKLWPSYETGAFGDIRGFCLGELN